MESPETAHGCGFRSIVESGATDPFLTAFKQDAAALKSLVVAAKGTATASIRDAGVVFVSGNHAVALLYIDQNVQNSLRSQKRLLRYRVEVDLVRQGNRWLTSAVKQL